MNNGKDALITSENENRLDYLVYSPPEGPKDLMHGKDCAASPKFLQLVQRCIENPDNLLRWFFFQK